MLGRTGIVGTASIPRRHPKQQTCDKMHRRKQMNGFLILVHLVAFLIVPPISNGVGAKASTRARARRQQPPRLQPRRHPSIPRRSRPPRSPCISPDYTCLCTMCTACVFVCPCKISTTNHHREGQGGVPHRIQEGWGTLLPFQDPQWQGRVPQDLIWCVQQT